MRLRPTANWASFAVALTLLGGDRASATPKGDADACVDAAEEGQKLSIEGKLRAARAQYLVCVKDVCPAVVRKDCAQFLVDLERATPTIVIAAREAGGGDLVDVRVTVDGKPFLARLVGKATPIDPGPHELHLEAAGMHAVKTTIVVIEGEHGRIVPVTMQPLVPVDVHADAPQPSSGPAAGAWIAAGIGVASLGTFAWLGLSARADYDDLRARCGSRCSDVDVDPARRKALWADVALGVAVVSIGVSTWLFVDHATRKPVEVRAAISPQFIGLVGAF